MSSTLKTFYKVSKLAGEEGLGFKVSKFISIHETQCFHFCVRERDMRLLADPIIGGKTKIEYARAAKHIKVFRMAKIGCRIAFETEQKAFENFVWLQNLRIGHLNRELIFTKKIIASCESQNISQFNADRWGHRYIPGTIDLVCEYYNFD